MTSLQMFSLKGPTVLKCRNHCGREGQGSFCRVTTNPVLAVGKTGISPGAHSPRPSPQDQPPAALAPQGTESRDETLGDEVGRRWWADPTYRAQ